MAMVKRWHLAMASQIRSHIQKHNRYLGTVKVKD